MSKAGIALTRKETARRVLVVLYKLSNGEANVPVSRKLLEEEVGRLGVLEMTLQEFNHFHRETVKALKKR